MADDIWLMKTHENIKLSVCVCLCVCHVDELETCKNGWTNRDALCEADSHGPVNHVLEGGTLLQVAKVMAATNCIATEHWSFNHICQVAPICTSRFLGPTRVFP